MKYRSQLRICVALMLANAAVLYASMEHAHLLGPLACNDNLDQASWTRWSEHPNLPQTSTSSLVEVPCGEKILMDIQGDITFGGGLVIHGHLKFEDTGIHITTDHVIVQGFLTIGEHQNPVTNQVIFTLTGTTEPDPTVLENVRGHCGAACTAGVQAFAVLGGALDLHGMPYDSTGEICPTWLELKDTVSTTPQTPSPRNNDIPGVCGKVFGNAGFEEATLRPEIPEACGKVVLNWNFEEPSPIPSLPPSCGDNLFVDGGLETGLVGSWQHTKSSSPLQIDTSQASEGSNSLYVPSPSSRVGQIIPNPTACLTAGVQYIFSAKVKIPSGANCYSEAAGYSNCPWVRLQWYNAAGQKKTTYFGDIEGKWGTDGEWNDLYVGVTFTEEHLASSEFFLYIDVSGDGEFWVDDAKLFQPPKPPAGWEIYDDRTAFIETVYDASEAHEGNAYMLMSRRNGQHRVGTYIDASCLTNGVHYLISAWVKVEPTHACFSGGSCPRIRLRYRKADGNRNWITLAETQKDTMIPGEWMYLWGHEIFPAGSSEDLETGSEFFLYVDVPGEADFQVDEVQFYLPELAPPPAWEKGEEYRGFLGIVSDGTAYEGSSYVKVYGRDSSSDIMYQQIENPGSCLEAGVSYVVSVMIKLPAGHSCFAADDDCPYLQLRTRHQGSDKYRYLADIDGPEGTDGEWNVLWSQTKFTQEELDADEAFIIEVRDRSHQDYFVDKAEILLAPQAGTADACENLIINGDFDWHHGSFAPWYVGGDEKIVASGGVGGGAYLLNFNRGSKYHGPGQYVDLGCIQTGAVYEFSASTLLPAADAHPCFASGSNCPKMVVRRTVNGVDKYRTHTQQGGTPGAWNAFTWSFMFTAEEAAADALYVYVEGGEANFAVGFDEIALTRVSLGKNAVIVDGRVADGCWAVGDELVVTPSDKEPDHAERRTITAVTTLDDGRAQVTLDANLEWMHEGEGLWHAEVMLLSRRIVVHGTPWNGERVAGHFWVSHTKAAQTIEGVELHTMGQQGTLGRYPMHLHMCLEMPETRISSISVHDTFQRCVVIHGTDNATIENNVAFDTQGHCFFLEDGYEEHNQFLNNIGALTRAPETVISSEETDDDPSTFWVSNPNNVWKGNVAAGSESSGYWFELRSSVRGPSAMLPKAMHYPSFGEGEHGNRLNPERHFMGVFEDNRAHSNERNGLQTYPSRGYNPKYGWADFVRFTTFRNGNAGLRFHISDHCRAVELLAADNRRGVDDDRNTDIEVRDSTIIGVSDAFKGKEHGNCPGRPAYGIELHMQRSDGDRLGTVISNVDFSGFDPSVCPDSAALVIDDEQQKFWDPRHIASGLSFDATSRRAYFQKVGYEDLNMGYELSDAQNQVAIQDSDGTLMEQPGYLVSNNPHIIDSAGGCTLHGYYDPLFTNLYTCPDACYRARTVSIPPFSTAWPAMEQPQLEVTWVDGNGETKTFLLNGTYDSVNDQKNQDNRRQDYYVVLPTGFDVSTRFLLAGETYTPVFIESPEVDGGYADPNPNCAGAFKSFSVDIPQQSPCSELLTNGDLESGEDNFWWVRGMYDGPGAKVVQGTAALPAASGSYYLEAAAAYRTSDWHGAGQYIPMDRMRVGETYKWRMQLRLPTLQGSEDVQLRMMLRKPKASTSYPYLTTIEVTGNGWVSLEHEFEWTETMDGFHSAMLYLQRIGTGLDVHYDDWSLQMVGCSDCNADSDCDDANVCNGVETCSLGRCVDNADPVCEADAPGCEGDWFCDAAEGCVCSCKVDGVCDFPFETESSCPQDCTTIQPTCGNGVCEPWGLVPENCANCADCTAPGIECLAQQPSFVCGNDVAEFGETCENCPHDVKDCDVPGGLGGAALKGEGSHAASLELGDGVRSTSDSSSNGPDMSAFIGVCVALAFVLAVLAAVVLKKKVSRRRQEQAEAEFKLGVIANDLIYGVDLKQGNSAAADSEAKESAMEAGEHRAAFTV